MGEGIRLEANKELVLVNSWGETLVININELGLFQVTYRSVSGAVYGSTMFGRYRKSSDSEMGSKVVQFPIGRSKGI